MREPDPATGTLVRPPGAVAETHRPAPGGASGSEGVRPHGWRRFFLPSFSDLLFISIIVWLFVVRPAGWLRLLGDGDTGWHIRVGQMILATGKVPHADPFSFSKPGAPWYAWEWLSDVGLALVHQLLGLKGVTLAAGVLIALFGTLLIRYMVWRGANLLIALGIGLVGLGAASIHYLARPHLWTLLLLVVALWILERDRRRPSPAVWVLIPLTALWTNLHGGFLALLACLGLLVAASALEGWVAEPGRAGRWRSTRRYALLGVGCAAASLVNPYGIQLHWHILHYLRSDWIKDVVVEFQSPSFRTENVFQFEILLFLGLMAAAVRMMRERFVEAGWIIAWAHLALGSIRHIPIFVIVAVPVIGVELTRLWDAWSRKATARSIRAILSRISADLEPGFRRSSVWPFLAVGFLVVSGGWMHWPRDFPAQRFPIAVINRHQERIAYARLFTEDQWADYLLYRFYPIQRVFVDGRSDFYGKKIGNEYLALMNGKKDWKQILEKYRFNLVLTPPDWPLASLLQESAGWQLLDADRQALLFARRANPGTRRVAARSKVFPPTGGEKAGTALMKQILPAESTRGDHAR